MQRGTRPCERRCDGEAIDERAYLVVAPHPNREAGKSGPLRRRIPQMSHVVIDPCGVRPVAHAMEHIKFYAGCNQVKVGPARNLLVGSTVVGSQ